jgi:acetyltransferase-like isoleucine patch superfamily enzyme
LYSTSISYILLLASGVKFGRGVLFDGVIRVVNYPKMDSVVIGNKCKFNSSSRSNLIGVNHKCIISTHLEGAKIRIGEKCGFSGTVIASFKSIEIGNNVRCGANTVITDSDWHLDDPRVGPPRPVVIKDNVWLGYNAVVLKGVTIGENSIIGAGSIVVSDIPANVIAAGNPCVVIKQLQVS